MISASHNPMPDNGIKIFGPGGHKLDDGTEDEIEALLERRSRVASGRRRDRPGHRRRGRGRPLPAPPEQGQHAAPRRVDRGGGLRPRRGLRGGPARLPRRRCPGDRDQRRPQRAQHQRQLRLHAPGFAARGRASRTAPTWAWRTTATPTAAWPSTPDGNLVDGDHIMVVLATGDARGRRTGVQDAGHHRDEQPGTAPGHALGRNHGAHHRRWRPLRRGGVAGRRLQPGRRAVRAHRDARAGLDR